MHRLNVLLAVVVSLSACSADAVSPRDQAIGVTAEFGNTGLVVRNHGDATIYYFAIEQQMMASANYVLCTEPPQCLRIDPRSSVRIAFDQIGGWSPAARNAVLLWWHLVPADTPGEFEIDTVRATVITR